MEVSVVLPTYNRASLLPDAIGGALGQGFRDFEIIVVDDGSTDETQDVLGRYGDAIRSFRQPNRGVNAARNLAVEKARGRYIALLDSDDVWLPYLLELLVGCLRQFPQAGFAFCDFHSWRPGAAPRPRGLLSWHQPGHRWDEVFEHQAKPGDIGLALPDGLPRRDFRIHWGDLYAASLHGPQVPTSCSLIRRERMGALRFPEDDSFCGDWEFFARLSHRHGAVFADVEGMLNRSHDDAVRLTRSDAGLQLRHQVAMIDRLWRQDAEFMAHHAGAVNRRQALLLVQLAWLEIQRGDVTGCRGCLARAKELDEHAGRSMRRVLSGASSLPGGGHALRLARSVRNRGRWIRDRLPRWRRPEDESDDRH